MRKGEFAPWKGGKGLGAIAILLGRIAKETRAPIPIGQIVLCATCIGIFTKHCLGHGELLDKIGGGILRTDHCGIRNVHITGSTRDILLGLAPAIKGPV
jgi:hypothetical protein